MQWRNPQPCPFRWPGATSSWGPEMALHRPPDRLWPEPVDMWALLCGGPDYRPQALLLPSISVTLY